MSHNSFGHLFRMTVVVILLSIGIAAFLGAVDFGFLYALNSYLNG